MYQHHEEAADLWSDQYKDIVEWALAGCNMIYEVSFIDDGTYTMPEANYICNMVRNEINDLHTNNIDLLQEHTPARLYSLIERIALRYKRDRKVKQPRAYTKQRHPLLKQPDSIDSTLKDLGFV